MIDQDKPELGRYKVTVATKSGEEHIIDPGGPYYIILKGKFIDYPLTDVWAIKCEETLY